MYSIAFLSLILFPCTLLHFYHLLYFHVQYCIFIIYYISMYSIAFLSLIIFPCTVLHFYHLLCFYVHYCIFGRIALAIPVYELAMSVCLSVRLSVHPSVCLSTFWLNFWFKQNLSYGYRYMFATWCVAYQ